MALVHWAHIKNGIVLNVSIGPDDDPELKERIRQIDGADEIVFLKAEDYVDGHVGRPGPNHTFDPKTRKFGDIHPDPHMVRKVREGKA
jgi:hypothetical protein